MEKYIALLRGINVGGNNRVPMPELKAIFEQLGFTNVVTYINSGNVVFNSSELAENDIKTLCETSLEDKFHFKIPVTIVSAKDLTDALNHAPSWWNTDDNAKHNAIFVIPPITVEEVFAQVGDIKPEYEKVDYYGRVIFWSAPIETFARTRWSKVVGTKVYNSITIRNANTTLKLADLVK